MKKIGKFGVLALLFAGMVFSTGVAAYRGDYSVKGPSHSGVRHELMRSALENADYDAWVALMPQDGRTPRVVNALNSENFELFAKSHLAWANGDYETVSELRSELGLKNGKGPADGTGYGKAHGMEQRSNMGQKLMRNHERTPKGNGVGRG